MFVPEANKVRGCLVGFPLSPIWIKMLVWINLSIQIMEAFVREGFFRDGRSMFFNWEGQVWRKLGFLHKALS